MLEPHLASWRDLDEFVNNSFAENDFHREIIRRHPFTIESINYLCRKGLEVGTGNLSIGFNGSYIPASENNRSHIFLNSRLKEYARDISLFHELGHAWYDQSAKFPFPDSALSQKEERHIRNGAIIEWLARQWRATPDLLRHAVHSFCLPEQIYDRASYEAFNLQEIEERQLTFSFYQRSTPQICPFTETIMDGA